MKYAIVIPDGAADEPQESLGGRTPLEAARTPNMDRVAAMGVVARALHTPRELPAGSEIGNLSLLGYNPFENFTGRAPMEAAAQGIKLGPEDWAVRCNLVTIEDQVMRDFMADHISTEEGTKLLASAQEQIASALRGALSLCRG
jgi:2,3-bisphosphoglycerate-independent phosphoglycerate mutase